METDAVTALVQDVCARVIWPRFRALEDHHVEHKRPGDLVTIADREAEEELGRALRAATPRALVVGEEAAFADPTIVDGLPDAAHAWVIDPVDGTKNFAHGSPDFGIMLAETRQGECVRSWIWQPAHELLYVAERGAGVRRNGEPMPPIGDRERPWKAAVYARLRKRPDLPDGWRFTHRMGAAAIDYPGVAEGRVDALAYKALHPWDHLPGALLLTELGGFVGVSGGRRWRPGVKGRVLYAAASRAVFDEVDAALTPSG